MTLYDCFEGCCKIEVIEYTTNKDRKPKRKLNKKAGIFIYDYNSGKVLLVQSRGNLWGVPKGTFEPDETKEDCAIREVKEETGLEIDKTKLTNLYQIDDNAFYYYINIKEVPVTIQKNIQDNDVNGLGWIKIDCLKKLIRKGTIKLNHHSRLCFNYFLNIQLPYAKIISNN